MESILLVIAVASSIMGAVWAGVAVWRFLRGEPQYVKSVFVNFDNYKGMEDNVRQIRKEG